MARMEWGNAEHNTHRTAQAAVCDHQLVLIGNVSRTTAPTTGHPEYTKACMHACMHSPVISKHWGR